jgi:hypothetical protein
MLRSICIASLIIVIVSYDFFSCVVLYCVSLCFVLSCLFLCCLAVSCFVLLNGFLWAPHSVIVLSYDAFSQGEELDSFEKRKRHKPVRICLRLVAFVLLPLSCCLCLVAFVLVFVLVLVPVFALVLVPVFVPVFDFVSFSRPLRPPSSLHPIHLPPPLQPLENKHLFLDFGLLSCRCLM